MQFSKSFLLLDENRFAHAATETLRHNQPSTRSPLVFVYGPSGVGKTHLVKQFLRGTTRTSDHTTSVHLTAAEFAAQFAEAADSKCIAEFQQRFRSLDILACEDIQALEDRHQTQWQLLWLIDDILASGGKVLLTSSQSPGQLNSFLPRLINRFHGGLCVPISVPDKPSRQSLIGHFASCQQIPLPANVVHFLADALTVTPRELLATVSQLDVAARMQKCPVDVGFTRRFLNSLSRGPALTVSQVTQVVARYFNISVPDLRSLSRSRSLVLPRQYAMYLSRQLTKQPYRQIGNYFGQRSHSTVVHACERFKKQLPNKPEARQHVTRLLQKLGVSPSQFG